MEYNRINYHGVDIHTIKTNQFKKCVCYVVFVDEAKKENMTKNALLGSLLGDSTKKYPIFSQYNAALEDLYGSKVNIDARVKGNLEFYYFKITFLNPKYSEKDQLEKNINFLFDTIYDPNIKNGKFNQTIFDYSKNFQANTIKSAFQQRTYYAVQQMYNILNDKMPDSFSADGYIADLEKLTSKNMVEYYHQFLNKSMHVFLPVTQMLPKQSNISRKDYR